MSEPFPELLRRAAAAQRSGRRIGACLVVSAHGSTPQPAGALMFIDDSGGLMGTIGGGCIEAEVRRRSMSLLAARGTAILRLRLDHDYGWDDGLLCGGTVEIAIAPAPDASALEALATRIERRQEAALELAVDSPGAPERFTLRIPPRARLLIAGAGHIGGTLARHAVALDFDATLFDDRPDLLDRAPRGVRTVCGPIAECLGREPLDPSTACVIVTRGHRHDQQALSVVLDRLRSRAETPLYVGMIGSRRKIRVIFEDLAARGAPPELLARVRAPIGLPIGAQTVEEIALSIAAELVQVRSTNGARSRRVERQALGPAAAPDPRPTGVLLAAGAGRRMGSTKQLLPLPGDPQRRPLVAAAFDAIAAHCRRLVVVAGHDSEAVLGALRGRAFTPATSEPGAPMSVSLRAGLRAALEVDPCASVLLHLADHPRVEPHTLDALLAAAGEHPGKAIIPAHGGLRGHPVLIPAALVAPLAAAQLPDGLRGWWRDHPDACVELPVEDASILLDVDTPEHYRTLDAADQPAALREPHP